MPSIWAGFDVALAFRTPQLSSDKADLLHSMTRRGKTRKKAAAGAKALDFKALIQGLPHILLVVDGENRIVFANFAAEVFFGVSEALLKKRALHSVLAFANPLAALANQVRLNRGTVNEYEVDLGSPDQPHRAVDIFASLLAEDQDHVLVMVQQRSMAAMIERQLTHRGAARSVSAMAAVLAHEIKNPLSGIRGAAQLLEAGAAEEDRPLAHLITEETDRIRDLVDRMEVFGDERPVHKESVNIHTVLDHVRQIARAGFARHARPGRRRPADWRSGVAPGHTLGRPIAPR